MDLIATIAKSSELINEGTASSSASNMDILDFKKNIILRSVSLNTALDSDLKFARKKDNEDLYYRIKSDP